MINFSTDILSHGMYSPVRWQSNERSVIPSASLRASKIDPEAFRSYIESGVGRQGLLAGRTSG